MAIHYDKLKKTKLCKTCGVVYFEIPETVKFHNNNNCLTNFCCRCKQRYPNDAKSRRYHEKYHCRKVG